MSRDGEAIADDGVGRAWLSVGAPILGLIFIVIMLAIAMLAGLAREQDEAYAQSTQQLIANSVESRGQMLASMALDTANWDEAYQAITVAWDQEWIDGMIYSSVSDGMILMRSDGVVRYAWFSDEYADVRTDAQTAAVVATRAIPGLRRLPFAETIQQTTARTITRLDGKLVVIGVAAVTPEDEAARLGRAPDANADFLISIDVVEPERLAAVGEALGLSDLSFMHLVGGVDPDGIHHTLTDASGRTIGALCWRHAHPGAAAFSRQIWPVVIGLLCIGLLAVVIAHLLVSRQTRAAARARAALDASQARSEFLTRVSHELRTPLNAIVGYAELIQEDAASQESRVDAGRIVSAARHLSHLLNDIIDQSRIDSGRLQLSCEVLPVAGLLAEVQGLLGSSARSAGVQLNISPSPVAGFVFADHVRMRQCLLNVIGNAIKFSPRGASVVVRTRIDDSTADKMVVVDVTDTGIGIAKSDFDMIFRPFGQAAAGIGRSFGGAGLGLSISRDLAREMGGDITVVSELGEGSTFSLAIPATAPKIERVAQYA